MLNYYFRSLKQKDLHKTPAPRKGSFIAAYDVTPEDLHTLVELGLDEALLEDATDYFEVPRFEYEEGTNYLFTRCVVTARGAELSTAPLLIAISDEYVLTLSHQKFEFIDDFVHGRKQRLITTQKVKSVIMMLEAIAADYNRSILAIRRTMLRHFGNVEHIDEKEIKEFVALESTIADYVSALGPTELALIEMLRRRRTLELHEDDIDLVEDLIQDVNQLIESAQGVSKIIENIRSAHSSILANKLNTTMKNLTAVTILLTIPTIVASLFGMNTWLPIHEGPLGFLVVMGIVGVLSFLAIRFFARNRWL